MSRPTVVTVCIWLLRIVGALATPTSVALACPWRSRPQHQRRTHALQQNERTMLRAELAHIGERHRRAGLVLGVHSMTSSARTSNEGGTVRPSAFAVLRLITNSNLVGICIGSSSGLVPLRMRST